jgi:hypothetical protein
MTKLFEPLMFLHGPAMTNRFMLAPMTNQQSHSDGCLSDDEHRWLTRRAAGAGQYRDRHGTNTQYRDRHGTRGDPGTGTAVAGAIPGQAPRAHPGAGITALGSRDRHRRVGITGQAPPGRDHGTGTAVVAAC